MQKPDSLYREVSTFIANKIQKNEIVRVQWAVAEILKTKQKIANDDADFYNVCAHHHIERLVKRVVGKYKTEPTTDKETTLFGYEYIQIAYTVQRKGVVELVPIHMLTSDERLARAAEYDAMAKGCMGHADELRRYDAEAQRGLAA